MTGSHGRERYDSRAAHAAQNLCFNFGECVETSLFELARGTADFRDARLQLLPQFSLLNAFSLRKPLR